MEPMTAKEFLALELRDFENGAIITSIVAALQERESLILQSKSIQADEELIEIERYMEKEKDAGRLDYWLYDKFKELLQGIKVDK